MMTTNAETRFRSLQLRRKLVCPRVNYRRRRQIDRHDRRLQTGPRIQTECERALRKLGPKLLIVFRRGTSQSAPAAAAEH